MPPVLAHVSITRLKLRSGWYFFPFLWHTIRSRIQAKRADGCLGISLRKKPGHAYWTLTVWRDTAAMRAFMASGAHLKAMPKLLDWCDEAAVAHWQQEGSSLPTWSEGEERLVREGRLSKVRNPSPAHAAGHILGSPRP